MDTAPERNEPVDRHHPAWHPQLRQHTFGFHDDEGSFCRCGERGPAVTMDGDPIEPPTD